MMCCMYVRAIDSTYSSLWAENSPCRRSFPGKEFPSRPFRFVVAMTVPRMISSLVLLLALPALVAAKAQPGEECDQANTKMQASPSRPVVVSQVTGPRRLAHSSCPATASPSRTAHGGATLRARRAPASSRSAAATSSQRTTRRAASSRLCAPRASSAQTRQTDARPSLPPAAAASSTATVRTAQSTQRARC